MPVLPLADNDLNLSPYMQQGDWPTLTYYVDPITNQLRGTVDGLEAMGQQTKAILLTERFKWVVMDKNDGVQLVDLIGQDYSFIASEIKRRIDDAFYPDRRYTGTSDWNILPYENDGKMTVYFTANTVYGSLYVTGEEISFAQASATTTDKAQYFIDVKNWEVRTNA